MDGWTKMDFTGERYLPSQQGQIKYEHLHRYAASLMFVEGKSVLDIASGEGYGAALLATKAQSVVGVDIDPRSVQHAQRSYYDPKLTFLVGSCDSIPLPSASFDVATSFETIEHHDKHEEMLREIKRVLKPSGLLIISSPNRLTYSDEPGYVNPFHVKELYFDEFHSLLSRHFKHVGIYGQRLATASFIAPLGGSAPSDIHALTGDVEGVVRGIPALPSPIYFVAVCSDMADSLQRNPSSVYLDPANDLLRQFESERATAVKQLQEELAETRRRYDGELRRQSNEFILATTRFRAMQRQYGATQHQHQQLIADLARRLEHHKAWLLEKHSQVATYADVLESIFTNRTATGRWQGLAKKLPRAQVQPSFEGVLDYPKSEIPATERIEIFGWVYSPETAVAAVQAFLGDAYLGIVRYGHERPDVAAAFPGQAPLRCGYKDQFWINNLGLTGPVVLRIIVTSQNGDRVVYTREITIAPSVSWPTAEDADSIHHRNVGEHRAKTDQIPIALDTALEELKKTIADFQARTGRDPSIVDWNTGMNLASALPNLAVCSPPDAAAPILPYLNRSIDFVVVSDAAMIEEARRVASTAIISIRPQGLKADWLEAAPAVSDVAATSIIIPVFNNATFTQNCLERLTKTLPPHFNGEIIVVDDASTDETAQLLTRWVELDSRIKVLRNSENDGFIRSCNRGAAAAQGEILVFLNNDTLPQPGWLPPLLRVFREHADAGAVGGKLIYPDGTLQEAGGVIFSDGSGCNFGKHAAAPDAPLYNFLRQVDYCSGALLATRRDLFRELGGFDLRFDPAYYEDADYCFSLRSKGRQVYFQPESVVVHFEGASCGTDVNAGVKSYQTVNREKFVDKWKDALLDQPPPPERYDFSTLQSLSDWRRGL